MMVEIAPLGRSKVILYGIADYRVVIIHQAPFIDAMYEWQNLFLIAAGIEMNNVDGRVSYDAKSTAQSSIDILSASVPEPTPLYNTTIKSYSDLSGSQSNICPEYPDGKSSLTSQRLKPPPKGEPEQVITPETVSSCTLHLESTPFLPRPGPGGAHHSVPQAQDNGLAPADQGGKLKTVIRRLRSRSLGKCLTQYRRLRKSLQNLRLTFCDVMFVVIYASSILDWTNSRLTPRTQFAAIGVIYEIPPGKDALSDSTGFSLVEDHTHTVTSRSRLTGKRYEMKEPILSGQFIAWCVEAAGTPGKPPVVWGDKQLLESLYMAREFFDRRSSWGRVGLFKTLASTESEASQAVFCFGAIVIGWSRRGIIAPRPLRSLRPGKYHARCDPMRPEILTLILLPSSPPPPPICMISRKHQKCGEDIRTQDGEGFALCVEGLAVGGHVNGIG
ncbi:uncharacterized protein BT62DRAFT_1011106 [Guyanagaster necrorhizus]|uniref:Uncharacterized protein n=1 Tax=Guyanagaster necrorhizus TaxID=856835 RepID=A0A9P7VIQ1_9AGAR|nr:uncharacterized protein BT62DRAFT_1011106 [Guyanagaster necrorhizus MCA 3950]KAG7441808.1 hypothetical protein BT62DRAFT_1011106 [Guyanagaster necrorhizus MCA 3950]